ncbi:MAG TPA: sigma-70 family RNA polymerase sigma factor [Candidatus Limnocylindria bacterium]
MRERPLSAFVAQALRDSELRRVRQADERSAAAHIPARIRSIDELAVAAAAGDAEAVGRLYDRMVAPIYRYVAVRVHRREDVEDLTQLVFERIVASLPRYRSRGRPFEAWAFRIARNAVIDHVRRDRAHEPLTDGHDTGHNETPDRLTERGEDIRELRRAIATLTPDQQEALALRFAAGLSAEEAGTVMGRQAGTVRGLTFRAIASLRRQLQPEGPMGR